MLKRSLYLSMVLLSGSVSGCALSPQESDEPFVFEGLTGEASSAATQADITWWKNLSQLQRNAAVYARASKDQGKYVGLDCKNWMRKVVSEASRGVVNLPSTCPNASGWSWCGSSFVQNMGSIYNASPGYIVQMNLKTSGGGVTPHTAMVQWQNGSQICWVDSNYVGSLKVGAHCQTISNFLNSVTVNGVPRYNLYRITGG